MNYYLSTIAEDAAPVAREYGLGLEIAEYCTAWNMDERFAETDALVLTKLEGIQKRILHAPFNELFPCAIDPRARALAQDRYRQALALAQCYGADKVVIHGGYNPWLYYPQWYVEQSIAFWRDFIGEVPETMEICLENVLEETPQMLLDILDATEDPRLGLCLDVGHVNAYSPQPPMAWLEQCARHIRHFHMHNNLGDWDSHSALMEGSIPMAELLQRANVLCPEASVTMELRETAPSIRWLIESNLYGGASWKI